MNTTRTAPMTLTACRTAPPLHRQAPTVGFVPADRTSTSDRFRGLYRCRLRFLVRVHCAAAGNCKEDDVHEDPVSEPRATQSKEKRQRARARAAAKLRLAGHRGG